MILPSFSESHRAKYTSGFQMNTITMDNTTVTLRQAFLIMHAYLEKEFELSPSDELAILLGNLALWETEKGNKEPIDAAVFPQWLDCANTVITTESTSQGYRDVDILLDGKPPTIKVLR
jgi:hypothetical protein